MAIFIEVDSHNRIVFSRVDGVLDFAACKEHMTRLRADPTFQQTYSQVLDFRNVDRLELSPDEVRILAKQTVFSPTSRRAFLVSTDLQFGLARMFGTHRDINGEGFVGVFRTVDQAADWIGHKPEFVEERLAKLGTTNV